MPMLERDRDHDRDRPRKPRGPRRLAIGATVGAVAALTVSSVLAVGGRDAGDQAPSTPNRVFEAPAGSCLDWSAADGSDVRIVPCEQPHLFESVGTLSL